MDQSDTGSMGIFSRRTHQTQEAWVYSQEGPIRRRKCGYILRRDQSDAESAGIFSRWTNQIRARHGHAAPANIWGGVEFSVFSGISKGSSDDSLDSPALFRRA
eukprot:5725026-Pyramimonas_sp.AAC.1